MNQKSILTIAQQLTETVPNFYMAETEILLKNEKKFFQLISSQLYFLATRKRSFFPLTNFHEKDSTNSLKS